MNLPTLQPSNTLCPKYSGATTPAMQTSELIGYLAAALTTCSFVPQALHTFRTRDVSGISLGMYSVFTAGLALSAWPIVVANAITLTLAGTILCMKLLYGVRRKG